MQRGLGTRRKAPGSMVGRCCARRSFWRMGSGSGVREPTRFVLAGSQPRYRYRYAAAAKTGGALRARRGAAARNGNAQPRPARLVLASPQSSTGRRS